MYDTGVRAQSRRADGASNDERVVDEEGGSRRGGNRAECGNDAGWGETKGKRGEEREERSRRAVSWRLRTVSWNEFCWINKFHYKNTLALSRGVSGCWFYPCLSVSANRYTAYMGPTPLFPTPPSSPFSLHFSLLSHASRLSRFPLSMYPPPRHSTMYE